MEKLSHLIADVVEARDWHPIKAGRNGPDISHLLFGDDLLFFVEASTTQMTKNMSVLDRFCQASGQKINIIKSGVFFLKNVAVDRHEEIVGMSGFSAASGLGRYIGSLPFVGKCNKGNFKSIIEKM